MNRGSVSASHPVVQLVRPFNEAPIHESGKYGARTPPASWTAPFNEAPIHESGKFLRFRFRSLS